MESNLGRVYYAQNPQITNYGGRRENIDALMPTISPQEAQKIANGLIALANYGKASTGLQESKATNPINIKSEDEEIFEETARLKNHPKLISYFALKNSAKYAVVINNSGRLMVDGNLFDGVIKIDETNGTKYVEYKCGNPITILQEHNDEDSDKTMATLTKYEYRKFSPYITKTQKSLIFAENSDRSGNKIKLAVPYEIQKQAGITQINNIIKQ